MYDKLVQLVILIVLFVFFYIFPIWAGIRARRRNNGCLAWVAFVGTFFLLGPLVGLLAFFMASPSPPSIERLRANKNIKGLIKALGYRDSQSWRETYVVRKDAAQALGQLGDVRAVEPLITALTDGDRTVREAAAQALGQLGDVRAVEPLITALTDSATTVRETAAQALGQLGDVRAVEPLMAALTDGDTTVREVAAASLGKLDWQPAGETGGRYWVVLKQWDKCVAMGSAAVEPLLVALKDSDSNVRQASAKALGQLGDAGAVGPLITVLRGKDKELSQTAVKVLVEIGIPSVSPLVTALRDPDKSVQQVAAEGLGKIGDTQAVEPLIAALEDSDSNVCQAAAGALGQLGDARAVEPLIAALDNPYWEVRKTAAEALGQLGDARAVKPLLVAAFREFNMREVATAALGQLGDAQGAKPLLVAALRDRDMREVAAAALEKLGWQPDVSEAGAQYWILLRKWEKCVALGGVAVEPLIAALDDEVTDVRQAAARALGRLGDARAAEPLIAALTDRDSSVRGSAAQALGRLGDVKAVEPLIAALTDDDRTVPQAAAGALDKLGWQPDRTESGAAYWITRHQWDQCIQIGASAVTPLVATLQDKDESVRQAAAEVLGRIGEPAVEPLIAALNNPDSNVRHAAANALGQLGDARAVEPLMAALKDAIHLVRRSAARALHELDRSGALNESDRLRILALESSTHINRTVPGPESAVSLASIRSPVFQWSGNVFVGSNQAWIDKLREENDSAIAWFNARNFAPIPTIAGENGAAEYCFDMASQAQNDGNVQEAWAGYHQALRRFCRLNDDKMIGLTSFNLGKVYGIRKDWSMAQLMFLESAYLTDRIGDKKGCAWSLFYLSDTCLQLGNKPLAMQFLSLALPVFREVLPQEVPGVEKALSRLSED
jgi:HEAT repeat protein